MITNLYLSVLGTVVHVMKLDYMGTARTLCPRSVDEISCTDGTIGVNGVMLIIEHDNSVK
jgi:hypothetical protein